MKFERLLAIGVAVAGASWLARASLTTKQREWTRDIRDSGRCQLNEMGIDHDCNGDIRKKNGNFRLQVHHIQPERYCDRLGIHADRADNVITICENGHVGEDGIHPDIFQARQNYRRGNKEAFEQAFANRETLLDNRHIYWDPKWDRLMSTRAIQLTQRAQANDQHFPEGRKR